MKKLFLSLALASTAALAQNAALMPMPRMTFTDQNNVPLAGGYLRTCVAGTACSALHPWSTPSNPLATYTDSSGSVANQNPIVLDSAGRASIWLGLGSYKIVLTDASGVTIWTQDGVSSTSLTAKTVTSGSAGSFGTLATTGAATIGGSLTVSGTISGRLRDFLSVMDYGAKCDGASDDTAVINAAATAAGTNGGLLFPAAKTCIVSGSLSPLSGQTWNGNGATLKLAASTSFAAFVPLVYLNGVSDVSIYGLAINGAKENLGGIPTTPVLTVSYAAAFKLNAATRVHLRDITISEFPGYGVQLYGSSYNTFANVNVINSGAKRAVAWSDTFMENFADGFFFGPNAGFTGGSDYNTIDGAIIGHDTTIANASAYRAGVTISWGSYNVVRNVTVYNASRGIHLESDASNYVVSHNTFSNISGPAIGDMDHDIIVYPFGSSDTFGDNDFDHVAFAKARRSVYSVVASVWDAAYSGNIYEDHFLMISNGKFPAALNLSGTATRIINVSAPSAFNVSPTVLTNSLFDGVTMHYISLAGQGKGITVRNSRFDQAGSVFGTGGASTIASMDDVNRFLNNKWIVSDLSASPALTATSPFVVDQNIFDYEGGSAGAKGFIDVNSQLTFNSLNIPTLARGNLFLNKAAASAQGLNLLFGARYTPDPSNVLVGTAFTNGIYYEVSATAVGGSGRTLLSPSGAPYLKYLDSGGSTLFQIDGTGNIFFKSQKALTGARTLCIDSTGNVYSSTVTCTGT